LFKIHTDLVVELAVDGEWPSSQRYVTKGEFRSYFTIKFMKDDVNYNDVGIQAVDSRRID